MTHTIDQQAEAHWLGLAGLLDFAIHYGQVRLREKGFLVQDEPGKEGGCVTSFFAEHERMLRSRKYPISYLLDKIIDDIARESKDCFGMSTQILRLGFKIHKEGSLVTMEYEAIVPWLPKGERIEAIRR